jgi:hypothetical protein
MLPEPNSYLTLHKYISLLFNANSKAPFPDNIMRLIHHISNSLINARDGKSKIDPNTEEGKEIISYEGYTGTRTRHFYNNICNSDELENIKYLEIGTWNGSSSMSAVYKNNITGLFIDNWSQFNGDSNIFRGNMSKFGKDADVFLLESDCWEVDLTNLDMGPFNIYLFDGDHAELDHYKALEYYIPILEDVFIFIVDDWNWPNVRDGTMRAIDELNLHVLFRHEEFVSEDDLQGMPEHHGKKTWWNGIGIFLLSKTPKSKTPKKLYKSKVEKLT